MKIIGIDLETDSLDVKTCKILEIAACIYDTDKKRIMGARCYQFKEEVNNNSEAIQINGLTKELLFSHGVFDTEKALIEISQMIMSCGAVCAHNGTNFDKIILDRYFINVIGAAPIMTWIDTKTDIEYPKHVKSNSLIPLAAYHGFLNPFPHNALFDVATMLTILSQYDINKVIERAKSPTIKVKIVVSRDLNEVLKERRFRWDATLKIWWKMIKECDLEYENKLFPYVKLEVV